MRQVPYYLIIGNGRLARHFSFYFNKLKIKYACWHRQLDIMLLEKRQAKASHILLLISDRAIESFIQQHLGKSKAHLIHCSGGLVSDLAYGAHPLMTFHDAMYSLPQYQSIPFVLDQDAPAMSLLLPCLPNPAFHLDKKQKAKYHALCVLSGNFSCLLWQKFLDTLEKEFHLPASLAHAYMQQQMTNLIRHHQTSLTGPLVRGDEDTIKRNLQALENDPFQSVYQSFVDCYQKMKEEAS